MENASKALIIAGAILLSILIIAIGMYVYNSAQSTINDSLTSMSSSEKSAFNSNFTGYQGSQTGSQVKSLIGDLVTNASIYADETAKIIPLYINKQSASNTSSAYANQPTAQSNTDDYVNSLSLIRNQLENKHTYWVELTYGTSGIINQIDVYYNQNESPNFGS